MQKEFKVQNTFHYDLPVLNNCEKYIYFVTAYNFLLKVKVHLAIHCINGTRYMNLDISYDI